MLSTNVREGLRLVGGKRGLIMLVAQAGVESGHLLPLQPRCLVRLGTWVVKVEAGKNGRWGGRLVAFAGWQCRPWEVWSFAD